MRHEETFFDSSLREALTGETPPDVLARVLERAGSPRTVGATGRNTTGRVTTRRWIVRVLGTLCLSVLAGGAASIAVLWFAPVPEADKVEAALNGADKSLQEAQERVADYDTKVLRRQAELERLSKEVSELEYRLASPEEKVERAMLARELKREERAKEAEIARRERHVAWAQEVSRKQRDLIMDGLVLTVGVNPEQKLGAEKVLDQWGSSVVNAISAHYPEDRRRRGSPHDEIHGRGDRRRNPPEWRRPDARECADSVLTINRETLDALRALLNGRQQLTFDGWLESDGGGVLKRGTDPWLPPALDLDDLQSFEEWRR